MTYLDEVVDPAELAKMLDEGYVQVRYHPDYPYAIYCYTKQAMFDRKWNNTTMTCRGLIVNEDTSEVLARPFKKFFNLGEPNAPVWDHTDWVDVYDKVDGSLGIAYETPEGPAIATKGSFISEQAVKATELLRAKYPQYMTEEGYTDLFEIIYPENRIVLDYGDEESLRYLGSVWIDDGVDYWNGYLMKYWDIPRNSLLESRPFGHLDLDMSRPNSEGYVLYKVDTGERLKVKQEDYLELHKVMTGLNERQIWEWLASGKSEVDILKDLPEELHDWTREVMTKIVYEYASIRDSVWASFKYWSSKAKDRREFAIGISNYPAVNKGMLFCMLDGNKDRADEIAWKAVRP